MISKARIGTWTGVIIGVASALNALPQIIPSSSTLSWTQIQYGPGSIPDPWGDQQTGSFEGDIVGNADNPSFYAAFYDGGTPSLFTDGELGFRFRLSDDKSPPGYTCVALVGMDLDANGSIDLFTGVDNSGSSAVIGLWWAGAGANTSPSTTSIANVPTYSYAQSDANYSWAAVTLDIDPSATSTDLDGGGDTDYFLSFTLPFADLVAMADDVVHGFDQNSVLQYVAITATQANSLNQDVNGVDGNVNSSETWTTLGALSSAYTAGCVPHLPEPTTSSLTCLAFMSLLLRKRHGSALHRSGGRDLHAASPDGFANGRH